MAALVKGAVRKKMDVSAVRGTSGNRALDWIIRFSTADATYDEHGLPPADGTINTAKFVTIFDDNMSSVAAVAHRESSQPRIYIHQDGPEGIRVSQVAAWIENQPDGFTDPVLHPMIDSAVDNGWLITVEYRSYADFEPIGELKMPDVIQLKAEAHNFNRPSYSRVEIMATANEAKPEWNVYMHSPSEEGIIGPRSVKITADQAQNLLNSLAPTLPTLGSRT